MGDVKTVKVDNWGSFFLQKLQNFFNKTDYCDLTLQFRDNSQLKVHRLVLSACTDYFNILETTTNVCNDPDILIMPRDLQADVVVPIVNFMYTGTLEFEVRMYERLLRTARDMKMSVLLKLLEAHRRAIPHQKPPPVVLNRGVVGRPAMRGGGYMSVSNRGRTMASLSNRGVPGEPISLLSRITSGGGGVKTNRMDMSYESKPLMADDDDDEEEPTTSSDFERLRRSGNENPNKRPATTIQMRSSSPPAKKPNLQDVKEYTEATKMRKQLIEGGGGDEDATNAAAADYEIDDTYSHSSEDQQQSSSTVTPRQSISLLSNASSASKISPKAQEATVVVPERPGQKMDHAKIIQEVMKKYPHLLKSNKNIKLKITQKTPGVAGTQFTVRAETTSGAPLTPAGTSIVKSSVAQASKTTPPGPGQRVMLRAGSSVPPSKSIVMKSTLPASPVTAKVSTPAASSAGGAGGTTVMKGNRIDSRTMHRLIAMGAENTEGPWLCLRCGVDGKPIGIPTYKAFRKHLINTHHEKIDPRLCEHCGHKSKNRNEMYHHLQTKHAIMPPQGFQYPICTTCKFVALDKAALTAHEKENSHGSAAVVPVSTRSKAAAATTPPVKKAKAVDEFTCRECEKTFLTRKALLMHQTVKHRDMKPRKVSRRRKQDLDDTDEEEEDDDEDVEEEEDEEEEPDFATLHDDEEYVPQSLEKTKRVQILSNVTLRTSKTRSSEADSLATVATGIATSLAVGSEDVSTEHVVVEEGEEYHVEEEVFDESETRYIEEAMANVHGEKTSSGEAQIVTKFLAEDGSELELTDKQKAELMSQLESTGATAESAANGSGEGTADEDGIVMMYESVADDGKEVVTEESAVLTDGEDVLMVYSGPKGKKGKKAATKKEDEQEDAQNEETVEDIKVEEVLNDSKTEVDEEKVADEKLKLLKELEGDWSEDKETEEEEEEGEGKAKKSDITETIMKDWEKTDEEEEQDGEESKAKKEEEDVKMEIEEDVVKTQPDEVLKSSEEAEEKEQTSSTVKDQAKSSKEPSKAGSTDKGKAESIAAFVHDWDDEEN